ncbi:hypothetical protein EDD18DRAFT_1105028 [Armillaria luteobubalina]|uniref:Uncharacterized protein n=1 Tax=Armillaria luteobubalina TaxID=153913 RepID=A0AA39UX61_9AGAR|nr:hypothetical protein EDD18DRAFT_1105028 [Armillaria luteobubalina]
MDVSANLEAKTYRNRETYCAETSQHTHPGNQPAVDQERIQTEFHNNLFAWELSASLPKVERRRISRSPSRSTSLVALRNSCRVHDEPYIRRGKRCENTAVKAYHTPESTASDPDLNIIASEDTQSRRERYKGHRVREGPLYCVAGRKGLKETKLLAELAKAKGIRTIVGLQARQSALFRKVKKLVEEGEIGDVLSTSMTSFSFCFPFLSCPERRVRKRNPNFGVSAGGSHCQLEHVAVEQRYVGAGKRLVGRCLRNLRSSFKAILYPDDVAFICGIIAAFGLHIKSLPQHYCHISEMGAKFDKILFQVATLRSIANRFFLLLAQKTATDFMTAIWIVLVPLHKLLQTCILHRRITVPNLIAILGKDSTMDGAQGELSSAIHHSYIFTMKGVNPYIYLVSPNIQEYVFSNYYPTSVPELWSLLPRQALFDRHRRRSSKSSCNRIASLFDIPSKIDLVAYDSTATFAFAGR